MGQVAKKVLFWPFFYHIFAFFDTFLSLLKDQPRLSRRSLWRSRIKQQTTNYELKVLKKARFLTLFAIFCHFLAFSFIF